MNFVKHSESAMHVRARVLCRAILSCLLLSCLIGLLGCSDEVTLPSQAQLTEFYNAGPAAPSVDMDKLVKARIHGGEYHVGPGEVLELTMPGILQVVTAQQPDGLTNNTPYMCRISDSGTITLPVVGEIKVAGKTLGEIESAIIDAYYPKYTVTRPSVFAKVAEYREAKVTITGAVANPGVYDLRSDQMSVVALIMEAGGVVEDGAAAIRIIRPDDEGQAEAAEGGDQEAQEKESVAGNGGKEQEKEEAVGKEDKAEAKVETANKPETAEVAKEDKTETVTKPETAEAAKAEPAKEVKESGQAKGEEVEELDVDLGFDQSDASSKTGTLTINYDDTKLELEGFDLGSADQKQALRERLSQDDKVLAEQVIKKLDELTAVLAGAKSDKQSETAEASEPGQLEKALGALGAPPVEANAVAETKATAETGETAKAKAAEPVEKDKDTELIESQVSAMVASHAKEAEDSNQILLPVRGQNIPFADVQIDDGDTVIVEPLQQPLFTVLGLVNKPGNFPYPSHARYNLMQALGFAQGLDPAAEPRYATIYRLKSDGGVTSATFEIVKTKKGTMFTDSLSVPIKPGDIVAVEQTPRTRTNLFFDRIFRINLGAYVPITNMGTR